MKFGEWVREVRLKEELDIRAFAEKTSVDSSTISRTENLQTETSIYTAYKICEGVGVSIRKLTQELGLGDFPMLDENNFINDNSILTLNGIKQNTREFFYDRKSAVEVLVGELDDLSRALFSERSKRVGRFREHMIPISPGDIDRYLFRPLLFQRLEINYPPISAETILETYRRRGALMISDVETYVFKRRERGFRSKSSHLPLGSLRLTGHLGSGSILERMPLSNVFDYDLESRQDGAVIGMYWDACSFFDSFKFNPKIPLYEQLSLFDFPDTGRPVSEHGDDWVNRLAMLYLTIYRWQQYLAKGK